MLCLAYHRLFLCLGSVLSFDLYGPLLWVESTVHFLCYLKYLDGFKGQFVLALEPCMFGVKCPVYSDAEGWFLRRPAGRIMADFLFSGFTNHGTLTNQGASPTMPNTNS
jgi:hypothetical protein